MFKKWNKRRKLNRKILKERKKENMNKKQLTLTVEDQRRFNKKSKNPKGEGIGTWINLKFPNKKSVNKKRYNRKRDKNEW